MGAVRQIVGVVYVRQRAVLMAIAKVCDVAAVAATTTTTTAATAAAACGTRTKHSNICTTTATTTTAAAAAIPIICRTSQGFRENGGSGTVVRQLSVLLLGLMIRLRVDRGTDTDSALRGHCTRRHGLIGRTRDDGGRRRNRRRTRSMYNTRTTTAIGKPGLLCRGERRKQIIRERRHHEVRAAQLAVCP